MNDAFNMSEEEGEKGYWRLLSDVIAGMILVFITRYYVCNGLLSRAFCQTNNIADKYSYH